MQYSRQQVDIFDAWRAGGQSLVGRARAGTGKTTTGVGCLQYMPLRTECIAYNRSVRDTLSARVPSGVRVATINGVGHSAIMRRFGAKAQFEASKGKTIARKVSGHWIKAHKRAWFSYAGIPWDMFDGLLRLVPGRLNQTVAYIKEVQPSGVEALGEALLGQDLLDVVPLEDAVQMVLECLQRSVKEFQEQGLFDHGDQIYLPAKLNLWPHHFDALLIDEVQDLSLGGLRLCLKSLASDGRILALGDPRQSLYRFRGAGTRAFDEAVAAFDARILPLSHSYRCGSSIVEYAKKSVPGLDDFEADPSTGAGQVLHVEPIWMIDAQGAKPGDLVLSRTNAPLIDLAIFWMKAGVPVSIRGRDFEMALEQTLDLSGQTSISGLDRWIQEQLDLEAKRLEESGDKAAYTSKNDRLEALRALCTQCTSVSDIKQKLRKLYSAGRGKTIELSTVHKAKGDEAPRVWLLDWTFEDRGTEDGDNCYYVGVTRAAQSLFVVMEPDSRGFHVYKAKGGKRLRIEAAFGR